MPPPPTLCSPRTRHGPLLCLPVAGEHQQQLRRKQPALCSHPCGAYSSPRSRLGLAPPRGRAAASGVSKQLSPGSSAVAASLLPSSQVLGLSRERPSCAALLRWRACSASQRSSGGLRWRVRASPGPDAPFLPSLGAARRPPPLAARAGTPCAAHRCAPARGSRFLCVAPFRRSGEEEVGDAAHE